MEQEQPIDAAQETGPYGLPASLFARLWSIDDVCAFCRIERTKARQLLAAPGAPRKMRMGSARCDRWNPVQVVQWLHGDWPSPGVPTVTRDEESAAEGSPPARLGRANGANASDAAFPGRPWDPSPLQGAR